MNTQVMTCTIVGKKGSGKSFFAGYLLEREVIENGIDFLVLDIRGDDHVKLSLLPKARLYRLIPNSSPDWGSLIKKYRRLVIVNDGCAPKIFIEHTETICGELMNVGERIVMFDEAQNIAPKQFPLPPNFQKVVTMGRTKGLDCIFVTQRPALLSSTPITQSNHFFIFSLFYKDDISSLRHSVPQEIINQVPSLPPFVCFHVTEEGRIEKVKAGERITQHGG